MCGRTRAGVQRARCSCLPVAAEGARFRDQHASRGLFASHFPASLTGSRRQLEVLDDDSVPIRVCLFIDLLPGLTSSLLKLLTIGCTTAGGGSSGCERPAVREALPVGRQQCPMSLTVGTFALVLSDLIRNNSRFALATALMIW